MSKSDAEEFNTVLSRIRLINDYDEAVEVFESLCSRYEKKYPAYIKMLKDNKEKYLCYKKYPERIQKHIYTTNIVENINSRFEVLRVNSGGVLSECKDSGNINLCSNKQDKTGKMEKAFNCIKGDYL